MGLDDFERLLCALDDELDAVNPDNRVSIQAIGGYAMICYNLRESGTAKDIDSWSILDDAVYAIAQSVGSSDWLNFHYRQRFKKLNKEYRPKFIPINAPYRNINMEIADLPSLIWLKLSALQDAAFAGCSISTIPRIQDVYDLRALFNKLGITGTDTLKEAFPLLWFLYCSNEPAFSRDGECNRPLFGDRMKEKETVFERFDLFDHSGQMSGASKICSIV